MKDLFSVKDKTVLVTGGSRGIGEMIATGFVEHGARVYIASRKKEACDSLAAELSKRGHCKSIPADLSSEAGAKKLAEELGQCEDQLQVLVNNAGANWAAPMADYDEAAWQKVLGLNVQGPFQLTRFLTPLLEKGAQPGDPARVINIGSIDGLRAPALKNLMQL